MDEEKKLTRFVQSIVEMDDFSKVDNKMSKDECYHLLMVIQKAAREVLK